MNSNEKGITLTIQNEIGIHMRPASTIVETLGPFDAEVSFEKDGTRVNAKSIMGILTLAAGKGTILRVFASGPQADEALAAVAKLVNDKFGEE
jgi:phosphocarrier protein